MHTSYKTYQAAYHTVHMHNKSLAGLCNSSPCFDQLDPKTSNGYKKGDHLTAFQMTGPDVGL